MFNIDINRSSKKSIEHIIVSFNNHVIKFNGKASIKLERVIRDKEEPEGNLFDCFNDYVQGTMDHDKQLALFQLFEKGHQVVNNPKLTPYENDLKDIKPIFNDLINFIDVPKYCGFIQYSKYLQIPKDLSKAASKGDYPEQTTIMDQDYVELVKLAFVSRVGFPIIFGLIARFDLSMGSGYSELVCGSLIKDNQWITHMPGWHKLNTYVRFAFDKRGTPLQADSVTSIENFVDKVLYNTLFSRLCCAMIPETDEGKNLATAINAAVKLHETGGTTFRDKERPTDEDDDKRSMYDKYQISEEVKSSDETTEAEFFSFGLYDENDAERYTDRFKYQCLALGIQQEALVEKVYDNLPKWHFELADHIRKLLQLTYKGVVSPFIWEACGYVQLMAAISLAQVKLSEMGYKYLPSVLGAVHDPNGVRYLADGLKLTTDDKDFLSSICEIQTRNNEGRSFNEALVAAEQFLTSFGNGRWQSNLEYGVLDNQDVYNRVKTGAMFSLDIDVEIKNEFMALIRQVSA